MNFMIIHDLFRRIEAKNMYGAINFSQFFIYGSGRIRERIFSLWVYIRVQIFLGLLQAMRKLLSLTRVI